MHYRAFYSSKSLTSRAILVHLSLWDEPRLRPFAVMGLQRKFLGTSPPLTGGEVLIGGLVTAVIAGNAMLILKKRTRQQPASEQAAAPATFPTS